MARSSHWWVRTHVVNQHLWHCSLCAVHSVLCLYQTSHGETTHSRPSMPWTSLYCPWTHGKNHVICYEIENSYITTKTLILYFDVSISSRDLHQKKLVLSSSEFWCDDQLSHQEGGRRRDSTDKGIKVLVVIYEFSTSYCYTNQMNLFLHVICCCYWWTFSPHRSVVRNLLR